MLISKIASTGGSDKRVTGWRWSLLIGLWLIMLPAFAWSLSYHVISIPTRDGKTLAADLYAVDTTAARPVILIQTPYNRITYRIRTTLPQAGGNLFPMDSLAYNYVVLDWRGFYGSKAAATANYDRGLDGYDAVEWVAQRRWCNGRVGTFGGSALGLIQFQTAKHHPPHLVCCVPMVKDYKTKYEDFFFGGDLRREHVQSLDSLGFLTIESIIAHPAKDPYWQLVETAADYPDSFAVPMFLVSGWYDHFPDGVLRAFRDMRERSDPSVRPLHRLLMGPWEHGGIGALSQGALEYPGATKIPDSLELQFFARYLRDVNNGWEQRPIVEYFQMGEDAWRTTTDWLSVAKAADTLFLGPGRLIVPSPAMSTEAPDSFVCNPRDPTPALGGSRFDPFDKSVLTGPQDLSLTIETRSDVLVFSTPLLTTPLVVDGQVTAELAIAIDRSDADVAVRLCDVYPDGRSMIMQQGIRRLRFRESAGRETPAVPGTVYTIAITLPDLALTFLPGHRLRLVVSGADYPHFDLNLNNGGPMYAAGDTLPVKIWIHHDAQNRSRIILPVAQALSPVSRAQTFGKPLPRAGVAKIVVLDNRDKHYLTSRELYDITGRRVFRGARSGVYIPGAQCK